MATTSQTLADSCPLYLPQVVSLQDQMEPFCQEHVKSCDGKLQDALRPYMQGNQQQAVHRRVIFTDAPHQYNTVALHEELLAAALMGSATKWAQVHAVLVAHGYSLTLNYTIKMLHLEVCRSTQTIRLLDSGCVPICFCPTVTSMPAPLSLCAVSLLCCH